MPMSFKPSRLSEQPSCLIRPRKADVEQRPASLSSQRDASRKPPKADSVTVYRYAFESMGKAVSPSPVTLELEATR